MESFFTVANAIIPVLIIIALGCYLKSISFFKEEGWDAVEKIAYFIFFPALIIYEISHANFNNSDFIKTVIALNCALLIMFFISFLSWSKKSMTGPRFSSIVQNNIRWNSYVVLGITSVLYPNHLPIVVLSIACMLPTANVLSVWTLLFWGDPDSKVKVNPITGLFKNPLILACIIGGLLQLYQVKIPNILDNVLGSIGSAAMPLGLLAVGAGLDFEKMRKNSSDRIFWALVRLVCFPIAALFCCMIFGVKDKDMILVAMMTTSAPTAANAYILAKQLGGDAPFMASLIGSSTLFSVITVPAMIFIYGHFYL